MIPEERNLGQQNNSASTDTSKNNAPYGTVSPDNVDEKIKNEPDTARLRSEKQSVIDGEKNQSQE